MRAVARGEGAAPCDAAEASLNSINVLIRLLTHENRELLATIRDRKPQSISELADMTDRSPSELTGTLKELETAGIIRVETIERRQVPILGVARIHVDIDPFSPNDRLDFV